MLLFLMILSKKGEWNDIIVKLVNIKVRRLS
jgi:hypothetical protein